MMTRSMYAKQEDDEGGRAAAAALPSIPKSWLTRSSKAP